MPSVVVILPQLFLILEKPIFFSKLEKQRELRIIAQKFNSTPEEIGTYTEELFKLLFSTVKGQSIAEARYMKYEQMVVSNRKTIDPASLPPTARAAHFHVLSLFKGKYGGDY